MRSTYAFAVAAAIAVQSSLAEETVWVYETYTDCSTVTSGLATVTPPSAGTAPLTTYTTTFHEFCGCTDTFTPKTYTVTEPCTQTGSALPSGYVPSGFVVTTATCHTCAETPIVATLTTPVPQAPVGSASSAPATAKAAPTAPASSPGSPPAANAPNAPAAPAAPVASNPPSGNAPAAAPASPGSGSAAPASPGSGSAAAPGGGAPAPAASAKAPVYPAAPVSPGSNQAPAAGNSSVLPFTGGASSLSYGSWTLPIVTGLSGAMAMMAYML
ncbi:hypothetical protein Q9189_001077 [Teloschistes chrysophthalmus]